MRKLFLSAVLICTAIAIVPTQTVMAQLQINGTGNSTTVAEFQVAINDFLWENPTVDVITITGELTNTTNESIWLDLPAGRRVVWQAEFYSAGSIVIRGTGFPNPTAGTFEIATGGKIQNTSMFGIAISI
ncbi:MAG: hypothetical protein FWC94_03385 [Bacteroidales bacterium]|nr:hypothetical protein [Bacteroidales bacterium]